MKHMDISPTACQALCPMLYPGILSQEQPSERLPKCYLHLMDEDMEAPSGHSLARICGLNV